MDISEKILRAKADYDEVYEAGKQAEYEALWDNLQQKGKRRNYWGGFAGPGWTDEIFKPQYPLEASMANYLFYYNSVTYSPKLTVFGGNAPNVFNTAQHLKWVDALVFADEAIILTGFFNGATALEHCPVEGVVGATVDASPCPFDKETIISWVNALSPTKTGLTLTLNLSAVNKAFETSEGVLDGSTSEEWLALIATKPNWTISLV